MTFVWLLVLIGGVAGAAIGSQRAVPAALAIARQLGVSAGLIGVTLVAIGTDLPEIANSISAAVGGHGDVLVGDTTGSAFTQVTLVLAILLLLVPAGPRRASATPTDPDNSGTRLVGPVGLTTVLALVVVAVLVADEWLGRADGLLLITIWVVVLLLVGRQGREDREPEAVDGPPLLPQVAILMGWFVLVAISAIGLVNAFVRIAEEIGVPELVASAIVLSLGTSLPELVVDGVAIRRGEPGLVLGDLFGSSLIDATLAVGIGPLIAPVAVSSDAVPSTLVMAAGMAAATWLVWRTRPTRALAYQLLVTYAIGIGALIALAST